MLWLCISLPQLPLEALHPRTLETPMIATRRTGNARWVVCCNEPAEHAGLRPGMKLNTALASLPGVQALDTSEQSQLAALTLLATWAYQFSSTVIIEPAAADPQATRDALWLEIGASLRLFGGLSPLVARLETTLAPLGYSHQLGIAPTLEGARVLARAGIRRATTTLDALRTRLASLPLHCLQLAAGTSQHLMTLGLDSAGALFRLPRAELARRFDPALCDYLDRLTGLRPDPRPVYRLPPHYTARFDFDSPLGNVTSMLFVLQRLLHEFAGFLRARDTGTQEFTLTLHHRDQQATCVQVRLSTPQRNAQHFMQLTREHLERLQLHASILAVELTAQHFTTPSALNTDLLTGTAEHEENFTHTLERLTARLGAQQVHGLRVHADHRPEACWAAEHDPRTSAALAFPIRPPWLLPHPQPLRATELPALIGPPERIAAGWWEAADIERDYFLARTSSGALWWVFQDRRDGSWHLHGLWS